MTHPYKAVRRVYGHRAISTESSDSLRKMVYELFFLQQVDRKSCVCCTVIARPPKDARVTIVQCLYDKSMGYGLTILYKLVEDAEPVNPYDNLKAVATSARKYRYGQFTGSVEILQIKCNQA